MRAKKDRKTNFNDSVNIFFIIFVIKKNYIYRILLNNSFYFIVLLKKILNILIEL
ncbi:hypothetical protein BHOIPH791_02350 [Bartonella henselae]|nr:hypothetical protein BH623125_11740 [Bartonella henselae]GFF03523.1 hypothetical protein BH80429_03440 [Bartonella henselae]